MAQAPLPERMLAVVLDSYSGVDALRVEQRPVPVPGDGEVLVKVAAAPINPSDLAFLVGRYAYTSPPPVVPGGEGAGTVVAAGPGAMGRYLLGRKVACLSSGHGSGTWAEYVVTAARGGALPLHRSVDLEQGAMSTINPLTAIAFLEIARRGGHEAIVLTAAASALGQMVNRLCRGAGIEVVNVVRRDAQVELLRRQGATIVVNTSEPGFEEALGDACRSCGARLAFDALAGDSTRQLLEALPEHGSVTLFGGLSFESVRADPAHLIFQQKSVDGFWLVPWLAGKHPLRLLAIWRRAQRMITSELRSEVRARYLLAEAPQAVRDYANRMTGGKVLLVAEA